jgi:mediator of RNA polymerase II transcription subunit 12
VNSTGTLIFLPQLLNTITTSTDLRKLDFFGVPGDVNEDLFSQKLDLLLSWCISPLQFGAHRPYAAETLLLLWRERAEEQSSIHDFISPQEQLQDELFYWLDTSDLAADDENEYNLSLLFGELIESGLFSYDVYLQRLIARGEAGLSFEEVRVHDNT